MSYYSATTFLTCLFALTKIVLILPNQDLDRRQKTGFIRTFLLLILAAALEWMVVMLDGSPEQYRTLHLLLKAAELSIVPSIALVWSHAMSDSRHTRAALLLCSVNLIIQIYSLFCGAIYYMDAQNTYCHGHYYWIYHLIELLSISLLFVCSISLSTRYQNHNLSGLLSIVAFTVIGIAIHTFFPGVRTDWLVATIAFSMLHTFCSALFDQADGLTALLNRRSYEMCLATLKKNAIFITFDVDDFKAVNDKFGHDAGDECLKSVGRVIKQTYRKYGLCFRIGGDEFCAILTRPVESIDQLGERFVRELDLEREENHLLPHVSFGYAAYTRGVNTPEAAAKSSDDMMFRYKKRHKENSTPPPDNYVNQKEDPLC